MRRCRKLHSQIYGGGGAKLRLIKSEKNSGGAGTPRNIGIGISKGEYLFFMDPDDAIMNTALKEIYSVAKKFDADVVHCGKYYRAPGETVTTDKNYLQEILMDMGENITEPVLESEKLEDRLKKFLQNKIWWVAWNQIIRRDFSAKNNFKFSNPSPADDFVSTFQMICSAEKFAILPQPYYIWRQRTDSLSQTSALSAEKHFKQWLRAIVHHLKNLDDIMNGFELFTRQPQYKYDVFEFFMMWHYTPKILPYYSQVPAVQFDEIIRAELEKVENTTALTAFLFSRMSVLNINLMQMQQQLQAQLNTRVQ